MGVQIQGKLNWLQRNLPEGLVVDAKWLEGRGYSGALRSKYVAHGWLDQVVRGVYRRPSPKLPSSPNGETLRWQQIVISLQMILGCPIVVGGRTALELQGFAHYLAPGGPREIHLYGERPAPGWVSTLELETRFVFHNAGKLFKDHPLRPSVGAQESHPQIAETTFDPLPGDLIRHQWGRGDWPLILSCPERAILELLDDVPNRETFHQADMLMEGLRNLSPRRLHALLLDCRSVKVKRLFLWFAERHNHAWLKKLDRNGIDLGRGKRMLVRGGKLDTKFNITVPENIDASG